MYVRGSRKNFADYFTPAEHAFVDWTTRHASSVLTGAADGRGRGMPGPSAVEESYAEGAANHAELVEAVSAVIKKFPTREQAAVVRNVIDALGPAARSSDMNSASHVMSPWEPSVVGAERAWSADAGRSLLLGGGGGDDEEGGGPPPRQGDNRRTQDRRRQDTRPEPPREVHPPAREDWCESELSRIASLRGARASYASDRENLMGELERVSRGDDGETDAQIKDLERQLHEKRQDLALINAGPLNTADCRPVKVGRNKWKQVCKPGVGPAPDLVNHQERLKLEGEIRALERRIEQLKGERKAAKIEGIRRKLRFVCGKLSENARHLAPAEEEFQRRCRVRLDPWFPQWRECNAFEKG